MQYLSVCSGIEAATVAWSPLGFEAVAFSEIDNFPAAVLAHHYPGVPNLGDMTKFKEWPDYEPDILVGGTPCQSFSVAGLRKGLADPRGNLMLTYLAIADRYQPEWIVWENVPGVLSSGSGRDFGTFLGALGQIGYGWAYRILDAQFFGVPQRRRRVFVVGHLGDWRRAAAVLLERESVRRNPAPRREAGERAAAGFERGPQGGRYTDLAPTLDTRAKDGPIRNQLGVGVMEPVAFADVSRANKRQNGPGFTDSGVAFTLTVGDNPGVLEIPDVASTMRGNGDAHSGYALADGLIAHTLRRGGEGGTTDLCMTPQLAVRRLTPRECERLQGFPDDHTRIPWRGKPADECPDGPRYKALGNSMATNCMQFIGRRIEAVEE